MMQTKFLCYFPAFHISVSQTSWREKASDLVRYRKMIDLIMSICWAPYNKAFITVPLKWNVNIIIK